MKHCRCLIDERIACKKACVTSISKRLISKVLNALIPDKRVIH
ncbi:hypothetical protein HMPREF3232_01134 [Fannyhessea vaginae]|nr:hypothetical protein HMPREF3232_01134 [Fannyhessea vaginae]